MTNLVQINLFTDTAILLFVYLNSVYSPNSEWDRPNGGGPPCNAARTLGDFPTCNYSSTDGVRGIWNTTSLFSEYAALKV